MKNKKAEMLKDFVSEAEEILDNLDQCLIQLDSAADKAKVKPDVINALFRGAHTLKGISGLAGLNKISKLSHVLEDIMDRLRLGKLRLTGAIVATLMEGVEALRQLVQSAPSRGDSGGDIESILQKIEQAMSEKAQPPPENPLEKKGIAPDLIKVLTEYESHRLAENIKQNQHIIEVKAVFDLQSFDQDLGTLLKKVQGLGEVITTLPASGLSPEKGIEFNIILGTELELENLKSSLRQKNITLRPIGPQGEAPASGEAPGQSQGEASATVRSLSQSIRVDINRLDSLLNVVGELVLNRAVINQICKEMMQSRGLADGVGELFKASQDLDRRVAELQDGLIEIRMVPVGLIFERLTLAVRKVCRELGKEVDLLVSGEETRLDKSMIEAVADPLLHMIRNSLDHGLESQEERKGLGKPLNGTLHLSAVQRGNSVAIELTDDGRGIELEKVYQTALERGLAEPGKNYSQQELLNFLFIPGFTTARSVSEVSGRGVGLDVVSKNIARLNGMVDIETTVGKGTKFTITLPITLVIIKALIVRAGSETYAIPLNGVSESLMMGEGDIRTVEGREVLQLRTHTLSLLRLSELFSLPPVQVKDKRLYVVVIGLAEKRIGLVVDAIEGQQEIVIKSIGETLRSVPGIAGATELGNRKTILVLDIGSLIDEITQSRSKTP